MAGRRAVIQGFGKVGGPLAYLLHSAGMRVVAVADVGGAVANEGGLDAGRLSDHVAAHRIGGRLQRRRADPGGGDLGHRVRAARAGRPRRRHRRGGRPAHPGPGDRGGGQRPHHRSTAQAVLDERGIVVVPDILANAGGVTASYFEWAQSRQGYPWDESTLAERLRTRMDDAFVTVWARAAAARRRPAPRRLRRRPRPHRRRHRGAGPLPVAAGADGHDPLRRWSPVPHAGTAPTSSSRRRCVRRRPPGDLDRPTSASAISGTRRSIGPDGSTRPGSTSRWAASGRSSQTLRHLGVRHRPVGGRA